MSVDDQPSLGFQTLLGELAVLLSILIRCRAGLTLLALLGRAGCSPGETIGLCELDCSPLDFRAGGLECWNVGVGRRASRIWAAEMKLAIAAAVLLLPLTYAAAPASAATASNSQAGADGHNKNMEKPTISKHMMKKHKKM